MRTILLLIAVAFLPACFMPASIDNRARNQALAEMRAEAAGIWRRMDAQLASAGWRPIGEPNEGMLEETYDESDDIRLTLPGAGMYGVVGICGSNCRDMDIVIMNSARRRVAADLEPDARPVATFEAEAGERYTARVSIPDCQRPPRHPQIDEEPKWACIYYTRLYRR